MIISTSEGWMREEAGQVEIEWMNGRVWGVSK